MSELNQDLKPTLRSDAQVMVPAGGKVEKPKVKVNHRYNRDKDRELVKGIFRFHEVPGGSMNFVYKAYKEDPLEKYTFIDGGIYTIPLGVAKHLNKNCWYPVHSYMQDEYGKPAMKVNQKVRRMSFNPLDFMEIDDLSPVGSHVVTAEMTGI